RDPEVQPDDPLAGTLADLAQAGLATHHALDPLSHQEAAALLADLLGDTAPAVRERILERTEGGPFFLVSCARGLRSAGPDASSAESLPWDLGQSIRRRVMALPIGARELLGVAAVVGRVVPRSVLLAAAEQQDLAVLAGLDAVCRA